MNSETAVIYHGGDPSAPNIILSQRCFMPDKFSLVPWLMSVRSYGVHGLSST